MDRKRISAGVSLIPLLVLIALLFLVVRTFKADALDGGSQVALLLASGVVIAIAMLGYKVPWSSLGGQSISLPHTV